MEPILSSSTSTTPTSTKQWGVANFTSNKVSLVYEKYVGFFPIKKEVAFCLLFDAKHIATSSLTKKGLKLGEVDHYNSYSKGLGVNCYAFISARTPLTTGDDPF